MSTTQTLYRTENMQHEPERILFKSISIDEKKKRPSKGIESIKSYSWEDYIGLSPGFLEDWS